EQRKKAGKKSFAVLIDPDKVNNASIEQLVGLGVDAQIDYFFVGGSLVISNHLDECIRQIKTSCNIPVILFPGSPSQI
ncbi:geranylgeranylglyceryl/heptaprenylglyceryl phosphate synthase, partial [Acinetobacter baumannii]